MIIMCEDCGKKFRIDLSRISGPIGKYKCSGCGNAIQVDREAAERAAQGLQPIEPPPEVAEAAAAAPESEVLPEGVVPLTEHTSPVPEESRVRGSGMVFKAVLLMLFLGLAPVAVLTGLVVFQFQDTTEQNVVRLNTQAAAELAGQVEAWMDRNSSALLTLSANTDMASMRDERQRPLLKGLVAKNPWMVLAYTVGPDGMNVARSDEQPLEDFSEAEFYKAIMGGKEFVRQPFISKNSGRPALLFAVPIRRNMQVIGILVSTMGMEDVSSLFTGWTQGDTGYAFLVDDSGKVIAHQDQGLAMRQADLAGHPLVAKFRSGQEGPGGFSDGGRDYVGGVKGTRMGWAVAIQQEKQEAYGQLNQVKLYGLAVLGASGLLILLISLSWAKRLSASLKTLTEAVERIGVGDLEANVPRLGNDELGALADAITRMRRSIRLSVERLRRNR